MNILFTGEYSDSKIAQSPLLVSRDLYEQMYETEHNLIYLSYFQDGSKYGRFKKVFGYEVIDKEKKIFRCGILVYVYLAIKFRPDIVHFVNLQLFYTILFIIRKILKFKIVYTMHGIASYEITHFRKLNQFQKWRLMLDEYLIMKYSNRIFALSNLTARYVQLHFKVRRNQITVISNGIKSASGEAKKCFNSDENLKGLFIGNIDRIEKGFDFVYNLMKENKLRLSITAVSECNDAIKKKYGDISIVNLMPNNILRKRMQDYHLLISSSHYELFSLALLEAMSSGLLFIASNRVGLTERFDKRLERLVYKHNSMGSFLETFSYLENLQPLERSILCDHIKSFSLKFSLKQVCDDYLKYYNEVCFTKN
jgi:glycosyltransferase involved in cell wall biosynthesis